MLNLIKRLIGYNPAAHTIEFPCNDLPCIEPELAEPHVHVPVIGEPVLSLCAALLHIDDWDYSTSYGKNGDWTSIHTYKHRSNGLEVAFCESWYKGGLTCLLKWATSDEVVALCEAHKAAKVRRAEMEAAAAQRKIVAEREKFMVFVTGDAA